MTTKKINHCTYVDNSLRLNFAEKNGEIFARYKPCCNLNSEKISPAMKNKTSISSIDEVFTGQSRRLWQEYFAANNELHPACIQCIDLESAGLKSPRIDANRNFNADKFEVFRLDITLSTECNLACTFCSPGSSSLIKKISRNDNTKNLPEQWKKINNEITPDATKTSNLISNFLEKYKVQMIKFIGGEPLLHNNWEPIASIIDKNILSETTLELTTNGTVINQRVLDNLSKVKSVKLRISVDSIGKNYDFLRWPHKFEKIDKILRFLQKNKPDNFDIRIACLVNIYNFEMLPLIEEYFNEIGFPVGYTFNLKPNNSIQHYQNIPIHIRQFVAERCSKESNLAMISDNITTDNTRSKEDIVRETRWFLEQRNMPSDVLAPMTREWLGL